MSTVGPKDGDHPLLVAAKKELLGTDDSTTLEQVMVAALLSMCIFFSKHCFKDLHNLFKKIDLDDDNVLSLEEVVIFFRAVTDELSMERIEDIFKAMDLNGDDSLDFSEFKVS